MPTDNHNTDAPFISVVITSYNRADLLAEAIRSVLNQSYQRFELVIVDDGSKDHSLKVIEAFQKENPGKICVFTHINQRNQGIVATYRLAISKARCEIIAFLEHDDRWAPEYLAKKMEIFSSYPEVAVVFSPYRVIGDSWFGYDMTVRQWLLRLTIRRGRPFDNFDHLLHSNNVATFSCFVSRKSLLDKIPMPSEDILAYDWWTLTWLSFDKLFYCDSNSFTYWRWTRQSAIGQQTFTEHRMSGSDFIEQMYHMVGENLGFLAESKRRIYRRRSKTIAYFLAFYRTPGLVNFSSFFLRSPLWALGSVASLIINYLKFRKN